MSLPRRLIWTAYVAYCLRGQARYPFKRLGSIQADQARNVRSTVAYAYRWVPYYRETMDRLGLRPADFHEAGDLAKLPLLRREDLQRAPESFVSTARPVGNYTAIRSSGSSGRPCTFYSNWSALLRTIGHGARSHAALATALGGGLDYRQTSIFPPAGAIWRAQSAPRPHVWAPGLPSGERQLLSVLDPPQVNVPLLNEFKPDVIFSHGSYLAALFRHLDATGQPCHLPKALLYTSDALPQSARQRINERYGIPVFSLYDAAEAHSIGFECEQHRGLHLNIDLYPLRIVDGQGRTQPVGSSGDIVISNLVNRGMVLLNMYIGDVGALQPDPCPCGRGLPLMSHVQGRSDDWIELQDGSAMHHHVLLGVLKFDEQVWQYQVVQETTTHFVIRLVPSPQCDREATSRRLQQEFPALLGQGTTLDVRFVDSIPPSPMGKVRSVISLRTRARLQKDTPSLVGES